VAAGGALLGLLDCVPSLAAAPFPGQTFTYSNPRAEVAARISDRAKRSPSDAPIIVWKDESAASFVFFSMGNDCLSSDIYPVIAVLENSRWNTIVFEGAKNHFWSHVYRSYPMASTCTRYLAPPAATPAVRSSWRPTWKRLPGGQHVYRTSDWGDTWAEAEFAETMLLFPDLPGNYAAEDVPIEVLMKRMAPNLQTQ
jgi:hypothetical protein